MGEQIVEFLRVSDYDPRLIAELLEGRMGFLRGLRGERVVVKPNLLMPAPPERAITTHPAVIEALLMVLRDWVKEVVVAESPGFGSLKRVLEVSGVAEVVERMRVSWVELGEGVEVKGSFFGTFEISPLLLDSVVVNVPKLKTHSMTLLTCCVKNMYGAVPGRRKLLYHFTAGRDRERFAALLLDVYRAVSPILNVVDGIVGMEGNGPSSGKPKRAEVLALGENGVLVDHLLSREMFGGLTPITVEVSQREGLLPENYSLRAEVSGFRFEPPSSYRSTFFNLEWARWFFDHLLPRVKVNHEKCSLCGTCVSHCPAGAMKVVDGRVRIDHRKCLRCYVCQELCPEGAVEVAGTLWDVIKYFFR